MAPFSVGRHAVQRAPEWLVLAALACRIAARPGRSGVVQAMSVIGWFGFLLVA
jgi:hypothetical protein